MGNRRSNLLLTWWQRFVLALTATMAGVFLSISASLGYDLLNEIFHFTPQSLQTDEAPSRLSFYASLATAIGLAVVAVLISLVAILFGRRALLRSDAEIWDEDAETQKFKAAIFSLSPVNLEAPENDALEKITENGPLSEEAKRNVLRELCDPNGPFQKWPWQQPLRLLLHNHNQLEIIRAILTPQAHGQFERFKAIAVPLLPAKASLDHVPQTPNRDNYDALTRALDTAISDIRRAGKRLSDICIDTSGATAVYSAAATVKALNSEMKLIYFRPHGGNDVGKPIVFKGTVK